MKMELNVMNKSLNRSALQILVLACLLALLAGCGDSIPNSSKSSTASSNKVESNQKGLLGKGPINLLSTGSGLKDSFGLSRFLSQGYTSKVDTKEAFSNSGESNFGSQPSSCLPVPLLVFYGIFPNNVDGSFVEGKIRKAFSITYTKNGEETLSLYIIKPKLSFAGVAFDSYKKQFSQCSKFKWSFSRDFSESSNSLLYQVATSTITSSTDNSFTGTLKSEIIFADEECSNFRCETEWNSTFVLRGIPGSILFGVINNSIEVNENRKAPDVSVRDVSELEELLLNLSRKVLAR
jgi:hypothetical protein